MASSATTDVEKWGGWISNAFSPNNPHFVALLHSIEAQLSIKLADSCSPQGVEAILPKLHALKLEANALLALTAEEQIKNSAKTTQALQGKFNDLQEATFGEAGTYFEGIGALLGQPDVDLMSAVEREHQSDVEFTTTNYKVTTTPKKEWALVFKDNKIERSRILGGKNSLPGGTINGCDMLPDRVWTDLGEMLNHAHELMNRGRDTLHHLTAAEFDTIKLMKEEVGCMRLYTGPMFMHYNNLLRIRGSNLHEFDVSKRAIEWARAKTRDGGKLPELDEKLFPPPHDNQIAKRAIVWSHLHSPTAQSMLETLPLESLVLDAVPHNAQEKSAKAMQLFPSLVFACDGKPPTMLDHMGVMWARKQLLAANAGESWEFELPTISTNEFDTAEKLKQVCSAIVHSRQMAVSLILFEKAVWDANCNMDSFPLEPTLGEEYTTTIHLISSGMIKLARLQPSVKLYRGFGGGRQRMPRMFDELHPKYNTQGGVEFAFMSCSQDRNVALNYSHKGYLLELKTGITTRGADLSWLSFYPEEREVCMPPCTAIEVLARSRVEDGVVVLDLIVVSNPAAATINRTLEQRKNVVLELGSIVAKSIPTESKYKFLMDGYNGTQKEQNYDLFNNAKRFTDCLQGMLDLSRGIASNENDPRELARFAISAKSSQVLTEMARGAALNPFAPLVNGGPGLLDVCMLEKFEEGVKVIVEHYHSNTLDVECSLVDCEERSSNEMRKIVNRLSNTCTELRIHCGDDLTSLSSDLFSDKLTKVSTLHFGHYILRYFISSGVGANLKTIELSLPISEILANELGDALIDKIIWPALESISFGHTFTTVTPKLLHGVLQRRELLRFPSPVFTTWISATKTANELRVAARELSGFATCLLGFHMNQLHSLKISGMTDNHLTYLLTGDRCRILFESNTATTTDCSLHFMEDAANSAQLQKTPFATLKTLSCTESHLGKVELAQILSFVSPAVLTNLDLSNSNLGDEGASRISEYLGSFTALTALNLSGNELRKSVKHLSTPLSALINLTDLNLSNNELGKEGAKHIVAPLTVLTKLTSLDLSSNKFREEGAELIAAPLALLTSLTSLNLAKSLFKEEGAKFVAASLSSLTALTSLNIGVNRFGAEGAKHFSQPLSSLTSLTELYLPRNYIGAEGIEYLSTSLAKLTALTRLDLCRNFLGAEGMSFFAASIAELTSLTDLDLSMNKLGEQGAKHIAPVLPNLKSVTSLNLEVNNLGLEGIKCICESLKTLTALTDLKLAKNDLNNAQESQFPQLLLQYQLPISQSNLEKPELVFAPMDSKCYLSDNAQQFVFLELGSQCVRSGARLTGSSMTDVMEFALQERASSLFTELAMHGKIQPCDPIPGYSSVLDFCASSWSHGLEIIKKRFVSSSSLHVNFNQNHPDARQALVDMTSKFSSMCTEFVLQCDSTNQANLDTAHTTLNSLTTNQNLKSILLVSPVLSSTADACGDALFETATVWPQLESIRFGHASNATAKLVHGVLARLGIFVPFSAEFNSWLHANHHQQTALVVSKPLGNIDCAVLGTALHQLDELVFQCSTVGNSQLTALICGHDVCGKKPLKLKTFELQGVTRIQDGLEIVKRCPTDLQSISLTGAHWHEQIMTEFATELLRFNSLSNLSLAGGAFMDGASIQLLTTLPKLASLTALDLSDCALLCQHVNELVGTFPQLKQLTVLSLANNHLGEEARQIFPSLAALTCLTSLNISNNKLGEEGAQHVATLLPSLTCLTKLNISGNELGAKGAEYISTVLATIVSLVELDVSNNNVGDKGSESIATALASLSSLNVLNLANNAIGEEGMEFISTALGSLTSLESLNLSRNEFGEEGTKHIAVPLALLPCLTSLDLARNYFGAQGAKNIATPLAVLLRLTSLNLASNDVGKIGLQHFVSTLATLTALTDLNLGGNKLGEEGAKLLASALVPLTSLTNLNLARNELGGSVKHIASSLTKLNSLTTLSLENNELGEMGAQLIAEPLCSLTHLTSLDLGGNGFGKEGAKYISTPLASLTNLTELNLAKNDLGEEGAKRISLSFVSLPSLTSLNLAVNKLGSEGAKYVAISLASLTALTKLNIAKNSLGTEGAKHIAISLSSLPLLAHLDVAKANLGEEGGKHFAVSLASMTTLTALDVSNNNVRGDAVPHIAKSLESLTYLTSLNLSKNHLGKKEKSTLLQALISLPCLFECHAICAKTNSKLRLGQENWFHHPKTNQDLCKAEYEKLEQKEKAGFVKVEHLFDVGEGYLKIKAGAVVEL